MSTLTRTPRRRPTSAGRDDPAGTLLSPAFLALGAADLAYFLAAGVAIYALPLYVTGPVGATEAGAGLAFGAFAATAIVLRPLVGRWCDTRGRRPLLVAGALLAAVALLATPLATTLAAVVVLRLLLGVAEALFFVASLAALADLAPPDRMGEAISYNSLGLYLGLALGAPLGEVLVRTVGFSGAWTGAGVLAAGAAALAGSIGETLAPRQVHARPSRLIHRPAIPVSLGFLASVVAMGGFLAFAPLYAGTVGPMSTSLPVFVYGTVVVCLRVGLARVQDRVSPLPVGAGALLAMATGLVVMALLATPAGLVAGALLLGAGVALSTPAFFAAVFATADPSSRGAAAGTASLALDAGIGGGPVLLGMVARSGGLQAAFVVAAAVALAGSAWTLRLVRDGRTGVDDAA
ncbi:MAG TPA: MFS transporter [Ornithinimicrobium sp.]|nr:MFS transporter [Ornithinimicrobium sp.]